MPDNAFALPDSLLSAAFAFEEGSLWRHLEEDDMFAVRYPDGKMGYCIVDILNSAKKEPSFHLVLYMEGNAMTSYRKLRRAQQEDDLFTMMNAIAQLEFLECRFAPRGDTRKRDIDALTAFGFDIKKRLTCPIFRRHRRYIDETFLENEEEAHRLRHALKAAAFLGNRAKTMASGAADPEEATEEALASLGFFKEEEIVPLLKVAPLHRDGFILSSWAIPEGGGITLEVPVLDEEQIETLRRLPKGRHKVLYCELISTGEGKRKRRRGPFLQVGLMIAAGDERATRLVYVNRFDTEMDALQAALIDALQEEGAPAMLVVRDALTFMFLKPFEQHMGIKLQMRKDVPILERRVVAYYIDKISQSPLLWGDKAQDAPEDGTTGR